MKIKADAEYKQWYNRGWQYAHRDGSEVEHGDRKGYPQAWHDGYLDFATGHDKWHKLTCKKCRIGIGCGQ